MAITISGVLRRASGVRANTKIILRAIKTSKKVIIYAPDTTIVTDASGNYSFNCEPCLYQVQIQEPGMQREAVGVIGVYIDSDPGDLESFLTQLKETDLTPEVVSLVVASAKAAKKSAEIATNAKNDAEKARDRTVIMRAEVEGFKNETEQFYVDTQVLNEQSTQHLAEIRQIKDQVTADGNNVNHNTQVVEDAKNQAIAAKDEAKTYLDQTKIASQTAVDAATSSLEHKKNAELAKTQSQSFAQASQEYRDQSQQYTEQVAGSIREVQQVKNEVSTLADSTRANATAAEQAKNLSAISAASAVAANTKAQRAKTASEQFKNQAQEASTNADAVLKRAEEVAGTITGVFIENGVADLSSGVAPEPVVSTGGVKLSTVWMVIKAGTLNGVKYTPGDLLVYSASINSYYRIGNKVRVVSVNGESGVVTITAQGIGALTKGEADSLYLPYEGSFTHSIKLQELTVGSDDHHVSMSTVGGNIPGAETTILKYLMKNVRGNGGGYEWVYELLDQDGNESIKKLMFLLIDELVDDGAQLRVNGDIAVVIGSNVYRVYHGRNLPPQLAISNPRDAHSGSLAIQEPFQVHNVGNGYPVTRGNVYSFGGGGAGDQSEIIVGMEPGADEVGSVYYRTKKNGLSWTPFVRLVTDRESVYTLKATTNQREINPSQTGISAGVSGIKPFFMANSTFWPGESGYSDVLVLDTYPDSTGGGGNALIFRKDRAAVYFASFEFNGQTWGDIKQLLTATDEGYLLGTNYVLLVDANGRQLGHFSGADNVFIANNHIVDDNLIRAIGIHNDGYPYVSSIAGGVKKLYYAGLEPKRLDSSGREAALTEHNRPSHLGLSMVEAYNNDYIVSYGNVLRLSGQSAAGDNEMLFEWHGATGSGGGGHAQRAFIRSRRDSGDSIWSPWDQLFTKHFPPTAKEVGAMQVNSVTYSTIDQWLKIARITMPQGAAMAHLRILGNSGYNAGSNYQSQYADVIFRSGNNSPKGLNGSVYFPRPENNLFTRLGWVNTSGDDYEIYIYAKATYARNIIIEHSCTHGIVTLLNEAMDTEPVGLAEAEMVTFLSNVNAPKAVKTSYGGSSWISQRDSSDVPIQTTPTDNSYLALARAIGSSQTFTMGSLGNSTMGFFVFSNSRTENGYDGAAYLDGNGDWNTSRNLLQKGQRVLSYDRTQLWSNSGGATSGDITLSESMMNFFRIAVVGADDSQNGPSYHEFDPELLFDSGLQTNRSFNIFSNRDLFWRIRTDDFVNLRADGENCRLYRIWGIGRR